MKNRYTEEQIVKFVRAAETTTTEPAAPQHGGCQHNSFVSGM